MIMMLEMNHGVSHQQRQQQRAVEGGIEFEGVRNLGAHLHGTFAAGLPPVCRRLAGGEAKKKGTCTQDY